MLSNEQVARLAYGAASVCYGLPPMYELSETTVDELVDLAHTVRTSEPGQLIQAGETGLSVQALNAFVHTARQALAIGDELGEAPAEVLDHQLLEVRASALGSAINFFKGATGTVESKDVVEAAAQFEDYLTSGAATE